MNSIFVRKTSTEGHSRSVLQSWLEAGPLRELQSRVADDKTHSPPNVTTHMLKEILIHLLVEAENRHYSSKCRTFFFFPLAVSSNLDFELTSHKHKHRIWDFLLLTEPSQLLTPRFNSKCHHSSLSLLSHSSLLFFFLTPRSFIP